MNINLLRDYPLQNLNTFKQNVNAKYFYSLKNISEFKYLLQQLPDSIRKNPNQILVLGGGSNVLFRRNFDGVVIHVENKGIEIFKETNKEIEIEVQAGEIWDDFVEWCTQKRLFGVENLSGIPGTVGASPVQNIGAYGMEVKDTIEYVNFVDLSSGEMKRYSNSDCRFSYRNSVFKNDLKGTFIIHSVVFRLKKLGLFKLSYGNIKDELRHFDNINLQTIRQSILNIRNSKLPATDDYPNAGSFFKNPTILNDKFNQLIINNPDIPYYEIDDESKKIPAAWLIEKSGGKKLKVNDASVHKKQALVIINNGSATGDEIFELSEKIKQAVFDKFGISLEREVQIIN